MALTPAEVFPPGRGRSPYQLLDVRAPREVARGALPGAVALPLLTDEERHLVGLRYQSAGQQAAIDLGYELLADSLPGRVEAWRAAVTAAPGPTAVACWRGGLRSALVTEFIGLPQAQRVEGGYRALRAHLVGSLPAAVSRRRVLVLGGMTGAGKTRLLRRLRAAAPGPAVLDLEGLANHRGSAFGHHVDEQPSQQAFENAVAAELVLGAAGGLVVEDESRYVGRVTLPDALHAAMQSAPLVLLETGLEDRAMAIHAEYVAAATAARGREAVGADLQESLRHLRRRLGAATSEALAGQVARLASSEAAWADPAAHAAWIVTLLAEHYDPLYRRSLGKLARPVLFAGDEEEVVAWLTANWN